MLEQKLKKENVSDKQKIKKIKKNKK